MSAIYARGGFIADTVPEPVGLIDFLAAPGNCTSVVLEPASRLQDLEPFLGQVAFITIKFPKFNDGRGYSLAARLRLHHGFRGVLRATGEVLTDQVQHFFRQGFDELEITHAPTLARLATATAPAYAHFMQADIPGSEAPPQTGHAYSWRRAN